jgi:hypothetical protein
MNNHAQEIQNLGRRLEVYLSSPEKMERVDELLKTARELERLACCLRHDANDEDCERVKRSPLAALFCNW